MSRHFALSFALVPLLLLAGCGDRQPATVNEAGNDSDLAQENVVVGDVTAIDAATADDSGMADDLAPPSPGENEVNSSNSARGNAN